MSLKNHEFVRRGNKAQHGQIHVNKAASTFLSANVAALPAYHAETTRLVCTLQVHSHRNSSPACWSVAELGRCLTCPMAAGCAGEIVEEIDASSTSPFTSDCKTTQSYANACQSFKTMDNAWHAHWEQAVQVGLLQKWRPLPCLCTPDCKLTMLCPTAQQDVQTMDMARICLEDMSRQHAMLWWPYRSMLVKSLTRWHCSRVTVIWR